MRVAAQSCGNFLAGTNGLEIVVHGHLSQQKKSPGFTGRSFTIHESPFPNQLCPAFLISMFPCSFVTCTFEPPLPTVPDAVLSLWSLLMFTPEKSELMSPFLVFNSTWNPDFSGTTTCTSPLRLSIWIRPSLLECTSTEPFEFSTR